MTKYALGVALLSGGLAVASLSAAQAPSNSGRTVWNGVYTADQARVGQMVFTDSCALCHGADLTGDRGPALIGHPFMVRWELRNANELFQHMAKRMPRDQPASLSADTYANLTAFLFQSNGFPAGQTPLPADPDTLAKIEIIDKNGRLPLETAMTVQAVGCLAREGTQWTVTNGAELLRVRNPNPSNAAELDEARQRTPGTMTIALREVRADAAKQVGHRVEAKGLLVRVRGQSDAIRVTTISTLDERCGPNTQ